MIVYGDILAAENFIMGIVILYITSLVIRQELSGGRRKLKVAAAGVMCGLFSLIMFTGIKMPAALIAEGVFAFAACFVAFGRENLWKKAAAFVLVTYFMGGMTMGLLLLTGQQGLYTASGIYTGDMKGGLLAVFTALCIVTARQIVRTVQQKKFYEEHCFDVAITSGDEVIQVKAFWDSGNSLTDPLSGRPVAVAGEALWRELESKGAMKHENFCMIPYETVGARGLMEAVKIERMTVGDRIIKNCIIAKGDGSIGSRQGDIGGCGMLLSREMSGE